MLHCYVGWQSISCKSKMRLNKALTNMRFPPLSKLVCTDNVSSHFFSLLLSVCRQNPLWEKVVVNNMELIFALCVMKFTYSSRGTSCCVWCSVVVTLTSQQKIIWLWLINYSSKVVFQKIIFFTLSQIFTGSKGPPQTCFSLANSCLIWFYTKTLKLHLHH